MYHFFKYFVRFRQNVITIGIVISQIHSLGQMTWERDHMKQNTPNWRIWFVEVLRWRGCDVFGKYILTFSAEIEPCKNFTWKANNCAICMFRLIFLRSRFICPLLYIALLLVRVYGKSSRPRSYSCKLGGADAETNRWIRQSGKSCTLRNSFSCKSRS